MPDRRILITGSRSWKNTQAIDDALRDWLFNNWMAIGSVTLVSGACRIGADRIAEGIWEGLGFPIERHPANWQAYGKQAGYIRNAEMVNLGADVCIAFIDNYSKGATHTADLAEKAGIPTIRIRE
jgi:hypothetical protein